MDVFDVDVVVIGCGIAGIAAARELLSSGLSVVVLEARDRLPSLCFVCVDCIRVGGRIHSHKFGPEHFRVNVGANFIHGCDPDGENALFNLAEDMEIPLLPAGLDKER